MAAIWLEPHFTSAGWWGLVSRRRESAVLYEEMRDRPLGVALQEEVSNCRELLQSKAAVVNMPG